MDRETVAFYVNLDHRTDRRIQIESELSFISSFVSSIRRIPAVRTPENGAIGCAASHALALSEFLFRTEAEFAFIFEDDFQFTVEHEKLPDIFSKIAALRDEFDALLLAFNNPIATRSPWDGFIRMYKSHTASAYFIGREFAYRLLPVFADAQRLLIANQRMRPVAVANSLWAIDVMWHPLQASARFFAANPPLGRQRASFSDILQKEVDYRA